MKYRKKMAQHTADGKKESSPGVNDPAVPNLSSTPDPALLETPEAGTTASGLVSPDAQAGTTASEPLPPDVQAGTAASAPVPLEAQAGTAASEPVPPDVQAGTTASEPVPVTTVAEIATEIADSKSKDVTAEQNAQKASNIIHHHMVASAAAAVIPVNFLDIAALVVVQLRMLEQLSVIYDVQFRRDIGRSAIGTLLATVAPTALGGSLLGSVAVRHALHLVPVVGPAVRMLTQPVINAAFTYALGKVFQQHFASGGTFLTFDPAKVENFFSEKFDKARRLDVKAAAAALSSLRTPARHGQEPALNR
jgi:uncharacterized protein (DUF697 family)